jgi:CubicO group peptidase (beta-lactamase class C family)
MKSLERGPRTSRLDRPVERRAAASATPVAPDTVRYGWTGGLGTTFFVDPHADLIGILLIQRLMTGPASDRIATDFRVCAYDAEAAPNTTR